MSAENKPIKVIGVSGGKGGVGKSNVCVNMGVALAQAGQRVTLLDADLGLANVDILLGLKPRRTLRDVVAGECTLEDVIVEGPGGLRIVPAASGIREMTGLGAADYAAIISAFNGIAGSVDVLLVDTAAGISPDVLSFLSAVQEVMVVVCNEPTSITDSYALIKVLNQSYGIDRFRIVANMVGPGERGQAVYDKLRRVADRFLDVFLDFAGAVPLDQHLRKAVAKQRSVMELFPDCASAKALREIAQRVQGWPVATGPQGRLEFFFDRLVAESRVA